MRWSGEGEAVDVAIAGPEGCENGGIGEGGAERSREDGGDCWVVGGHGGVGVRGVKWVTVVRRARKLHTSY